MIDRILRSPKKPKGCILCLPNRNCKGRDLAEVYRASLLNRTMIVGMTPRDEWYPPPHAVDDQADAVAGLPHALEMLDSVLSRLRKGMGVKRERTVLVGFGTGAVVALEALSHTNHPFAAVVSHSGCILEPAKLPPCRHHETRVILTHSKDNRLYRWDKRYIPTKEALILGGYDVVSIERDQGGHALFKDDVIQVANLIAPILGYSYDWWHPMTDLL